MPQHTGCVIATDVFQIHPGFFIKQNGGANVGVFVAGTLQLFIMKVACLVRWDGETGTGMTGPHLRGCIFNTVIGDKIGFRTLGRKADQTKE